MQVNDLLCSCWYQWMFVLILLYAGLPAFAGGPKMFVQVSAKVFDSKFGLLEVRCWQDF